VEAQLRRARQQAEIAHLRVERERAKQLGKAIKSVGNLGARADFRALREPRLTGAWVPRVTSGDYHADQATLEKLRGFSQQFTRNNPIAIALVRRLVDLVVGQGFRAQVRSGDADWDAKAERLFARWAAGECDARGRATLGTLARQALHLMIVDGDVLPLVARFHGGPDRVVVQLIEADRIASPADEKHKKPNTVAGVQVDALGAVVACYVRNYAQTGSGLSPDGQWISSGLGQLMLDPERSSVTRGTPALAPLVIHLDQIDRYIEAELVKASVNACIALKRTRSGDAQNQLSAVGPEVRVAAPWPASGMVTERLETMRSGIIYDLQAGENLEMLAAESPSAGLGPFLDKITQICSACLGLPLVLATLDFSQTNFHSARTALGLSWARIAHLQSVLEHGFYRLAWKAFIGDAMEKGLLPQIDNAHDVTFLRPGRPVIDPQREVAASLLAIEGNIDTRANVLARMGLDAEEVARQRQVERELEAELGITPRASPTGQAGAAGGPTDPNAPTDPVPVDPAAQPPIDPADAEDLTQ
jgi:lambda family phage portal protein